MSESFQSGFRPANTQQSPVAQSALVDQAQQIVALQKDTAAMLESVFRTVEAATINAAKVVMPNVTAKIAEMGELVAKENDLIAREKSLSVANAAHAAEKERHAAIVNEFVAEQEKWKTERVAEDKEREAKLYQRYIAPDYVALPAALRGEDAQEFVKKLIPYLEANTINGGRLRAALTAVALAEATNEEDDFLKAVQELYHPAIAFSTESEFISNLKRLLSSKGKELLTIEIPQTTEPFNPQTMSPATGDLAAGRPITKVIKWGVKFANKDKRKRALVA